MSQFMFLLVVGMSLITLGASLTLLIKVVGSETLTTFGRWLVVSVAMLMFAMSLFGFAASSQFVP